MSSSLLSVSPSASRPAHKTFLNDGRLEVLQIDRTTASSQIIRCRTRRHDGPSTAVIVKRFFRSADKSGHERAVHAYVSGGPHIARVLGTFTDEATVCMVLEYAEHGTLRTAIVDTKLFKGNNDLVRTALLQLADALMFCHEIGVAHGDLNPENILCQREPKFKLLLADFGCASTATQCARLPWTPGTDAYVSPERLGVEFTLPSLCHKRSDIWSFGIVAITIICAHAPWQNATSTSPNFTLFLSEPNELRTFLALSVDATEVLKTALMLNPMARASLVYIRAKLSEVGSFFMSARDLVHRPWFVQRAAKYYGEPTLPISQSRVAPLSRTGRLRTASYAFGTTSVPPKMSMRRASGSRCSTNSDALDIAFQCPNELDDETVILHPSPALAVEPLRQHEPQLGKIADIANSLSGEGCRSGSDDDEDEVRTPYSYPVKVEVEVPEMDLDAGFLSVRPRRRRVSWTDQAVSRKRSEKQRAVSLQIR